jgi:hypothetical protein
LVLFSPLIFPFSFSFFSPPKMYSTSLLNSFENFMG